MGLALITAPSVEPVTLAEVKAHLRVTVADDDTLLDALILAVRQQLEGRDGWLNRALITSVWDLTLDAFPSGVIELSLAPIQSVTHIKYFDTAGIEQTWATSKYQVDTKSIPARIEPAYGQVYPTTRGILNAVTIRFTAGYGDDAANVPEPIKLALKCLVAHFYENREPVMVGAPVAELPMHVQALLAPYRVWMPGNF